MHASEARFTKGEQLVTRPKYALSLCLGYMWARPSFGLLQASASFQSRCNSSRFKPTAAPLCMRNW